MTYHKEGPACGKIPCDPTSSEADCEYPLDPNQVSPLDQWGEAIKSWKKLRNDAIIKHVPKKVD